MFLAGKIGKIIHKWEMFQHAVFDYRRVDYHVWLFINRIVHWFSEDPMISSGHRDKMPLKWCPCWVKIQTTILYMGMDQNQLYYNLAWMNIHLPVMLMFTRVPWFWHTAMFIICDMDCIKIKYPTVDEYLFPAKLPVCGCFALPDTSISDVVGYSN